MLKAAINYQKMGKNDKAKELLKQLKKDYPQTLASRDADRYLTQLN
jgi:TolA-binding protein